MADLSERVWSVPYSRRPVLSAIGPSGQITEAASARPGELYRCAGCNGPLEALDVGFSRIFCHQHTKRYCPLFESPAHFRAKFSLATAITGGTECRIVRVCPGCSARRVQAVPRRPSLRAVLESPIVCGRSTFWLDVAIFEGDELVAAFEVLKSAPVSKGKRSLLPIPWAEIRAEEVLFAARMVRHRGLYILYLHDDHLRPIGCQRPCPDDAEVQWANEPHYAELIQRDVRPVDRQGQQRGVQIDVHPEHSGPPRNGWLGNSQAWVRDTSSPASESSFRPFEIPARRSTYDYRKWIKNSGNGSPIGAGG